MRTRSHRWWLGGLAAAGVALSHEIAYRLAHADPVQRVHVLNETGHDYMPLMARGSFMLAVLALVFFVVQRFSVGQGERLSVARVSGALFAFQAAGYLFQEFVERAASGHGLSLALSPIAVALVLQLFIAIVLAFVLGALARTIEKLCAGRPHPERTETVKGTHSRDHVVAQVPLRGGLGLRGPPAPESISHAA
jgi:hypothetical protein